jgi:hypothetical protein
MVTSFIKQAAASKPSQACEQWRLAVRRGFMPAISADEPSLTKKVPRLENCFQLAALLWDCFATRQD